MRIAIGAQLRDIFRMMIGEGLTLSLTGLAIGLVGAWWLGRAGSSLLFGVTASDPSTFTTVSLLLTAVAIAACYFPARRAMKVDPVVALRVIVMSERFTHARAGRCRMWPINRRQIGTIRISGGGEGRCSASSSSDFFRFSRLVRA